MSMFDFNWGVFWALVAALVVRGVWRWAVHLKRKVEEREEAERAVDDFMRKGRIP